MKSFRAAAGQARIRFFQEKPSLDDGGVFHCLIVLPATMPTPEEVVDAAGKNRRVASLWTISAGTLLVRFC